jgi:hypothetical protein
MVNMIYNPDAELEEGESAVVSYDTVDNIRSNQNYYYTAVATDFHGNVSVPSPIYRVRLVSENGLLLPEVEIYKPKFSKPQLPSKKFARFIQIKASGIQAFPFAETNDDGETTILRSLGSTKSDAITSNNFVLRLTSKDTGKKFDLHLAFDNQDTPINDEDE